MLRAIGIYEIDTSNTPCQFIKTNHTAPKAQLLTLFNFHPLASLEQNTFPQLTPSDLEATGTLHFQDQQEHHYLRRVAGKPYLMAICSRKRLEPKETAYLMINIQHAFEQPDSSRVKLEDIIINPLGYIATDHLIASTRQDIEALKQISLNNINSLLERGERIDDLRESTLKLTDMSTTFKRRAEEQNSWCGGSYCVI